MYHIPLAEGTFGSRVGVTLATGQPLSLSAVTVLSDATKA